MIKGKKQREKAAQELIELRVHEWVNSRFVELPCGLLIFTEITVYKYFSL